MSMKKLLCLMLLSSSLSAFSVNEHVLTISPKKIGAPIPSTLYGIFFEDINFAADGGLYGELVKNRSFEFPDHFMGWNVFGNVKLNNDGPFDKNPHYVRLGYSGHNDKHSGLENEGYFGIGYNKNNLYRFSVWARVPEGGTSTLHVMFCDPNNRNGNQQIAETDVVVEGKEWKKYSVEIRATKTVDKGSLRVVLRKESNVVDLEHISLFPVDTWNGHENGMRKDLAQALAESLDSLADVSLRVLIWQLVINGKTLSDQLKTVH